MNRTLPVALLSTLCLWARGPAELDERDTATSRFALTRPGSLAPTEATLRLNRDLDALTELVLPKEASTAGFSTTWEPIKLAPVLLAKNKVSSLLFHCHRQPPTRPYWEDSTRGWLVKRFCVTAFRAAWAPMKTARAATAGTLRWAWLFGVLCVVAQTAAWIGLVPKDAEYVVAFAGVLAVGWTLVLPLGEFATLRLAGIETRLGDHFKVNAFASVYALLPWCGFMFLPLWALVVRPAVLRSAFDVSWGQAFSAAAALPVTLACVIVVTRADLFLWL